MNFLKDTSCNGEGEPCLFVCFLFATEKEGLVTEFEVLVIGNLEWGPVTLEETKK